MGDSATLSNLAPLGIAFALLLVGGVAAMWRLSWSVIPTRDAWPARLRRMAGQSPWTKRDLAWLLLLLATAQLLRHLWLPDTAAWHLASFHGILLAGILWRMRCTHQTLSTRLPWRSVAAQSCLRWLAILPILWFAGFVWQLTLRACGYVPDMQQAIRLFIGIQSPWLRAGFLLFAVGIAPIVEEVLFRGILLPLISRRLGPWAGLILTALGFAALHGDPGAFVALVIFAIALALAYIRTGSLLVPIAMHMVFNAVNLGLIFLLMHAGVSP